jgi:chitinase
MHDPMAAYQQSYDAEMSVDGLPDQAAQPLRGHLNQLRKLKARHPNLKVVVSLGGWGGSTWFSDAAKTPESRRRFVAACIDTYIRGNLPEQNGAGGPGVAAGILDGFDLDWEYPVQGGAPGTHHDPDDGANFTLLLQEFRAQFAAMGRSDLLLTMAAPGSARQADEFRIAQDHPYLDYLSLMTYDFRGAWSRRTGHHTNLCTSSRDPLPQRQQLSMDLIVRLYRDTYGVPPEKIVPGAAFHGHGWQGVSDADHGLYQRAAGSVPGTYEADAEYYVDLMPRLSQGYEQHWDDLARAAWMYNPSTGVLWSYDEPQSLALKAEYVKYHGLGGIMFWEISGDDPEGTLVGTLHVGLQASVPATDPCSPTALSP